MGHRIPVHGVRVAASIAVALMMSADRPAELHAEALARVAARIEAQIVTLAVDLHEPDLRAETMQSPTLERKGWHHDNPTGPVALRAGSRVEVTGVFNYSERGLFLELAREEGSPARSSPATRPRIRIRIMVETPNTDPEGQRAEALGLIARVIGLPPEP